MLNIQNYVLYRTDRPESDVRTRGGGVLLYVKHELLPQPCPAASNFAYREFASCIIRPAPQSHILVILAYRPDSNSAEQNVELYRLISSAADLGCSRVLLLGDFNFKDVDWVSYQWPSSCDDFVEATLNSGLHQHNHLPTHRSGSILDLVFTNELYDIADIEIGPGLGQSVHFSVWFSVICEQSPCNRQKGIKRDFMHVNWDRFRRVLSSYLSIIRLSVDCSIWDFVKSAVLLTIERVVPLRHRGNVSMKKPVWADRACWDALRHQKTRLRKYERSHDSADLDAYNAASRIASEETRRSAYRFEGLLAANIDSDVKSLWRYVNSSLKCSPRVGPIRKSDGSYTQSDEECANEMANFFYSVYRPEVDPCPQLSYRTESRLASVDFPLEQC
jgi:hypothetical protein